MAGLVLSGIHETWRAKVFKTGAGDLKCNGAGGVGDPWKVAGGTWMVRQSGASRECASRGGCRGRCCGQ